MRRHMDYFGRPPPSKRIRLSPDSSDSDDDHIHNNRTTRYQETTLKVLEDSSTIAEIIAFLPCSDKLFWLGEPITKSFSKSLRAPNAWGKVHNLFPLHSFSTSRKIACSPLVSCVVEWPATLIKQRGGALFSIVPQILFSSSSL